MNAPADNRGDGGGREVMRSECDANSVRVGDYPRPTSVKGRVLAALLAGAELTHLDCWERFDSSRLAHHVHMLRDGGAGWPIQSVERPVPTSDGRQAIIAFYSLPKATIDQAGDAGAAYIAKVAAAGGGHDCRPRHGKARRACPDAQ